VYDVSGKEVAVLVNERQPAGNYRVTFDGQGLASGVYFANLKAGDPSASSGQSFIATRKMLLIR